MNSIAKYLAIVAICIAGTFLLAFILIVLMTHPSLKIIAEWEQPPHITYGQDHPHYLSVAEYDRSYVGLLFLDVERNYIIYAGRDTGKLNHGHVVRFSFHMQHPETLKEFLQRALVIWTEEGVELQLPSEHRLFIPKDMFIKGR